MFGKNVFRVVRNGIDVKRFQFNVENRARIRSELGINASDTVLLHAGRYETAKNHDFLIDIFNTYLALDPSAKLILLGDGSLFSSIKHKVDGLGIDNAVYMLGKRANTEDYYSASDAFIMPSFYEGLPVTLVEAQMNGLACVVSDTIDQSVKYGLVDFYSLEKTAKEWAEYVKRIDHKHRPSDDILINDYDISNTVNQLKEVYEAN